MSKPRAVFATVVFLFFPLAGKSQQTSQEQGRITASPAPVQTQKSESGGALDWYDSASKTCGVQAALTDYQSVRSDKTRTEIEKAHKCMDKAAREHDVAERKIERDREKYEEADKQADDLKKKPPKPVQNPTYSGDGNPPGTPNPGTSTGVNGQRVINSAYKTVSACDPNSVPSLGNSVINVHRELITPKIASDVFGRRLGKRYFVYQVTVTNQSPDFQYIASDISVDFGDVFKSLGMKVACDTAYAKCLGSAHDIDLLRGVTEKGGDYDPRNLSLHILQGIGSVSAGVSGLTAFSDVMGPAIANYNGAFLQSFIGILPDHSIAQTNRLSDAAFTPNTLIDRLHTKKFAVFIPEAAVLHSKEQTKYWNHTRELLDDVPFDQVNVCVDGNLVTQVSTTAVPAISPPEGTIPPGQLISFTLPEANAQIYYTLNGDIPTTKSAQYTTPFDPTTTAGVSGDSFIVKYIAVAPNKMVSAVGITHYATRARTADPTVKPASGSIKSTDPITITPAQGALAYYTVDGSDPGTSGTRRQYVNPFSMGANSTLRVIDQAENLSISNEVKIVYTISPGS